MLYVPSIFGENLMDDWMDNWDRDWMDFDKAYNKAMKKNPLYGKNAKNLMKTDVRELDDSYEVDIDVPGFKKEDIELSLDQGFLNIVAAKGLDKEETDKKSGKIIRQERYTGTMSRSFYVGEDLKVEDIKAKLEHGVLKLTVPKVEHKEEIPAKKTIMIEG